MRMRWDKWGAQLLIRSGSLAAIEHIEARKENLLRVLAYHRIGDPEHDCERGDPSLISATPASFAEQMAYLAAHNHVVSAEELLNAFAQGERLPPRSVMVTFDDGYHDFLDLAWPVLARYHVPAILFVPSGYLQGCGRMFWWDRLHQAFMRTQCSELHLPPLGIWRWNSPAQRTRVLRTIKRQVKQLHHEQAMALVDAVVAGLQVDIDSQRMMLTWDEIRQMAQNGLYVGAHTVSHPILSRISQEQARQEIIGSQEAVRRELGRAWPIFCYPVGHPPDLRPDLVSVLKEQGFRAAFTMIEGHNDLNRVNPLRLKRIGVAPHLTLDEFRLVLTRAYNAYGTLVRGSAE